MWTKKNYHKNPKVYGFFDTETFHIKDMELAGLDIRPVGNTLHVFEHGIDTGMKPTTYVKCASLITVDYATREEHRFNLDTAEDILTALIDNNVDRAYSHNYRFDGAFLMSYIFEHNREVLLPNGWTVRHEKTIMGKRGIIYQDTLLYTKDKKKHRVDLRDSAKIWNVPLRKLGEAFGVLKGNEALTCGVNDEVRDYCMQDSNIIKIAIMWVIDKVAELTNHEVLDGYMTSASMAYNLGMHWLRTQSLGLSTSKFDEFCQQYLPPVDEEHGFPPWIRRLYKGATPLLNKRKIRHLIRNLRVYDVNSMYPKQMYSSDMPICAPRKLENPMDLIKCKGLWMAKVCIIADVKNKHRATFIDKNNHDTLVEHMEYLGSDDESDHNSWCYIDNVDYEMICRDYNISYFRPVEVYSMRSMKGMFAGFIAYWYDVKKTTKDEAMRAFAKLIINSFYGKFGTRPDMEECIYGWKDGVLCVETLPTTVKQTRAFYLPIAIWTTSYARNLISKACSILGWSHVVYTDTDSLHIVGLSKDECERRFHENGIGTSSSIIGDFKDETGDKAIDGIYIRNKGYYHFWHGSGTHKEKYYELVDDVLVQKSRIVEHYDGQIEEIKMAGCNEFPGHECLKDILGHNDLTAVQRRGYRVHGGILIVESVKDINNEDDSLHLVFKLPGMSEEATQEHIISSIIDKARKECQKRTKKELHEHGCIEDEKAYMRDIHAEENDRYWYNHTELSFAQQMWNDIRTQERGY